MPISPKCVLDKTIINDESITELSDLSLTFFADLCGRNRGAMILPHDNHTYGCLIFPDDFSLRAGMARNFPLSKANDINTNFQQKNITGAETIAALDYFVQNVYTSSPKVQEDPYACNVAGLATLDCAGATASPPVLRAATLAGLFTYVPWVTGGVRLTVEEAQGFYTSADFDDMKQLGLNAVQIPVPHTIFHHPDSAWLDLLTDVLQMASASSLQAILVLPDGDERDVTEAAQYADRQGVFGLTVPSQHSLATARGAAPALKLFVPVLQDDLKHFDNKQDDPNVFAALDLGHTGTVADIASSSSGEDRSKLFYHESLSCVLRSPLEFSACYKDTPVFVAKGFDISIDDCVYQKYDQDFRDFGQCGRFQETVDSPWWKDHRKSFFDRQRFSYEKGMGWSYAAWKLYKDHKHPVLDQPEQLLALKDVAAAGYVKNLRHTDEYSAACLNPPHADFILGDATLAPTPAPPPDCGNGWWNTTINDCTYWVPPVTIPPTPCPMCAEVEACPTSPNAMLIGGVAGILGLIIGAVVGKVGNRRREGYEQVSVVV